MSDSAATLLGSVRTVEGIRQGEHVCFAFAEAGEQRSVMTAYLRRGLELGERVVYFADANAPEQVIGWLEADGLETAPRLASGQLAVTTARESYLAQGAFDPEVMLDGLREEVDASLASGYPGVRLSGEMDWALRDVPGAERLHEYEAGIDAIYTGRRVSGICQYDARRFPGPALAGFERLHTVRLVPPPLYRDELLRLQPDFLGGRHLLRVMGLVDLRHTALFEHALEVAASWPGELRVDLDHLTYIDAAGVRELVRAAHRLPPAARVLLVAAPPQLGRMLSLAGWNGHPGLEIVSFRGEAA